jgi:hypothetical protein
MRPGAGTNHVAGLAMRYINAQANFSARCVVGALSSHKESVMKGAAVNVRFEAYSVVLGLEDGRVPYFPLGQLPVLQSVSSGEREHFAISIDKQQLYWPELNADINVTALLLPLDGARLE